MKDYEQRYSELLKENFNLKLRIYFLEENAQKFSHQSGIDIDAYKLNIELQIKLENQKKIIEENENIIKKHSFDKMIVDGSFENNALEKDLMEDITALKSKIINQELMIETILSSRKNLEEQNDSLVQQIELLKLQCSQLQDLTTKNNEENQEIIVDKESILDHFNFLLKTRDIVAQQVESEQLQDIQRLQRKLHLLDQANKKLFDKSIQTEAFNPSNKNSPLKNFEENNWNRRSSMPIEIINCAKIVRTPSPIRSYNLSYISVESLKRNRKSLVKEFVTEFNDQKLNNTFTIDNSNKKINSETRDDLLNNTKIHKNFQSENININIKDVELLHKNKPLYKTYSLDPLFDDDIYQKNEDKILNKSFSVDSYLNLTDSFSLNENLDIDRTIMKLGNLNKNCSKLRKEKLSHLDDRFMNNNLRLSLMKAVKEDICNDAKFNIWNKFKLNIIELTSKSLNDLDFNKLKNEMVVLCREMDFQFKKTMHHKSAKYDNDRLSQEININANLVDFNRSNEYVSNFKKNIEDDAQIQYNIVDHLPDNETCFFKLNEEIYKNDILIDTLRKEINNYKGQIEDQLELKKEISLLNAEIEFYKQRDIDIVSLQNEIDIKNAEIENYKSKLEDCKIISLNSDSKQVNDLKSEIESFRIQLGEYSSIDVMKNTLESNIFTLNKNIQKLQEDLVMNNLEIFENKELCNRLDKEKMDILKEKLRLEVREQECEEEIKNLKDVVNNTGNEIKKFENKLEELTELQMKFSELQNLYDKVLDEKTKLNEILSQLQSDYDKLIKSELHYKMISTDLELKVESLNEISLCNDQIIHSSNKKHNTINTSFNNNSDALIVDLSQANGLSDVDNLEMDLTNRLDNMKNLTSKNDVMQIEFTNLKEDYDEKCEKLKEAIEKNEMMQIKFDELHQECRNVNHQLQNEIVENNNLKSALSNKTDELLDKIEKQKRKYEDQILSLEYEHRKYKDSINSKVTVLEEQSVSNLQLVEAYTIQIAELKMALANKNAAVVNEHDGENSYDNLVLDLNVALKKKEDEIDNFKSSLFTKQSEMVFLEQQNKQLTDEVNFVNSLINKKESRILALESIVITRQNEIDARQVEFKEMIKKCVSQELELEKLKQIIDKLERDKDTLEALNIKLLDLEKENTTLKASKSEFDNLKIECDRMQSDLNSLNELVINKDEIYNQLNEQLSKLQTLYSKNIENMDVLQKELTDLKLKSVENDHAEKYVLEKSQLIDRINILTNQLETQELEISKKQKEYITKYEEVLSKEVGLQAKETNLLEKANEIKIKENYLVNKELEINNKESFIDTREKFICDKESDVISKDLDVKNKLINLKNEEHDVNKKLLELKEMEQNLESKFIELKNKEFEIKVKYNNLNAQEIIIKDKFADLNCQKELFETQFKDLKVQEIELGERFKQLKMNEDSIKMKELDVNTILNDFKNKENEIRNKLIEIKEKELSLDVKFMELKNSDLDLKEKYNNLNDQEIIIKDKFAELKNQKESFEMRNDNLKIKENELDIRLNQFKMNEASINILKSDLETKLEIMKSKEIELQIKEANVSKKACELVNKIEELKLENIRTKMDVVDFPDQSNKNITTIMPNKINLNSSSKHSVIIDVNQSGRDLNHSDTFRHIYVNFNNKSGIPNIQIDNSKFGFQESHSENSNLVTLSCAKCDITIRNVLCDMCILKSKINCAKEKIFNGNLNKSQDDKLEKVLIELEISNMIIANMKEHILINGLDDISFAKKRKPFNPDLIVRLTREIHKMKTIIKGLDNQESSNKNFLSTIDSDMKININYTQHMNSRELIDFKAIRDLNNLNKDHKQLNHISTQTNDELELNENQDSFEQMYKSNSVFDKSDNNVISQLIDNNYKMGQLSDTIYLDFENCLGILTKILQSPNFDISFIKNNSIRYKKEEIYSSFKILQKIFEIIFNRHLSDISSNLSKMPSNQKCDGGDMDAILQIPDSNIHSSIENEINISLFNENEALKIKVIEFKKKYSMMKKNIRDAQKRLNENNLRKQRFLTGDSKEDCCVIKQINEARRILSEAHDNLQHVHRYNSTTD